MDTCVSDNYYAPLESGTTRCADCKWDSVLKCQLKDNGKSCDGEPTAVAHATFTCDPPVEGQTFLEGSKCTFKCASGYVAHPYGKPSAWTAAGKNIITQCQHSQWTENVCAKGNYGLYVSVAKFGQKFRNNT